MNLEGRLVSGLLAAIVSLSGCRIESSAISSTDMRETVQSQREFERAVKHNFDYDGGDRREMEGLIRSSTTSRVVMFGISHGERPQDRKDGNFVAHLLSYYHRLGFKYVAVEAPASLNNYLKTPKFEESLKRKEKTRTEILEERLLAVSFKLYPKHLENKESIEKEEGKETNEAIVFDFLAEKFDEQRLLNYQNV